MKLVLALAMFSGARVSTVVGDSTPMTAVAFDKSPPVISLNAATYAARPASTADDSGVLGYRDFPASAYVGQGDDKPKREKKDGALDHGKMKEGTFLDDPEFVVEGLGSSDNADLFGFALVPPVRIAYFK